MSTVLVSTIDYHRQRRPFLSVAESDEDAIYQLNLARRRLREVSAEVPRSETAIRDAEAAVLDQIRVLHATHWLMATVPAQQPPTIDQGQTTNLDAMSRVMSHVAPVGPGSNTVHDPYMARRNQGAYFCPWHGRYVNHDAASCVDGEFFESSRVSLAQFQGLGLRAPGRQRRLRRQANNQTRGPPRQGQPLPRVHGQRASYHDRRPQASSRRQHQRSRSPRRRQDDRSRSPRRQRDRSRSPRRRVDRRERR